VERKRRTRDKRHGVTRHFLFRGLEVLRSLLFSRNLMWAASVCGGLTAQIPSIGSKRPLRKKFKDYQMSGPGSGGNVLAALCSFFIPGLGQLLQGRALMALVQFILAGVLWFFFLGWLVHLWSVIDAARFKPQID
jgi:TM2 domain-containing membrane protein YozV